MRRSFLAMLALGYLCVAPLRPTARASEPDYALRGRMERLEAETVSLRAELQWLRENPVRLPAVSATSVSATSVSATPVSLSVAPMDAEVRPWGDIPWEMSWLAWKTGDDTVVPYGVLWGSIFYDTERTDRGPYTRFVHSADTEAEDGFNVDARRTRLGMNIGERAFDGPGFDDAMRRTWSFNTDITIPIAQRFGFQGEFFTREDRGTFLGGVVQGINRTSFADGGTGNAIRSTGGWLELWYDLTPRLHTYTGYGIDDRLDKDVAATGRSYNHFAFATATFDVTRKLNVAVELSSWKTLYPALSPGEAVRFEFAGKYAF